MRQIVVARQEAGQRLDKLLHKILCDAPGSFIHKMLRKKNITLNEKKAEGSERVSAGDLVTFFLSDETFDKFAPGYSGRAQDQKSERTGDAAAASADIVRTEEYKRAYHSIGRLLTVYEDENILIVDKPAGLLTQKARPGDISLNEWLTGYLLAEGKISRETLRTFKPSVCNRLDRNTGGLVICGCSLAGSQKMGALLKDRKLRKYYRLVVKGDVREAACLKGYLKKTENGNRVSLMTEKAYNGLGQEEKQSYVKICTNYVPLYSNGGLTMLEAELVTGKTHQIRAHLAGAGHPLLGDYKYGDRVLNDRFRIQFGIESQLLYSYRLEFPDMQAPFEALDRRVVKGCLPDIFHRIM